MKIERRPGTEGGASAVVRHEGQEIGLEALPWVMEEQVIAVGQLRVDCFNDDPIGIGVPFLPWPKHFILTRIEVTCQARWRFRIGEKNYYNGEGPSDLTLCSLQDAVDFGIIIGPRRAFSMVLDQPIRTGVVRLHGILLREWC